jgi:hypothetical protein
MNTKVRENLVRFKNKITGESIIVPRDYRIHIVDGKEFVEYIDSKNRKLRIAKDSLEKVRV